MGKGLNFLAAILIITAIAAVALASRSCSAPAVPVCFDPLRTMPEAAARAADSGRPVLVFVTADWCEECRTLKRGALNSGRVTDWISVNTEPVYLDVTRAASGDTDAQAAMSRLNVDAPPAIVLLRRGREVGRVAGAPGSKALLESLKKIVAQAR
jgi:thioredoxin:protein disulfide reductase